MATIYMLIGIPGSGKSTYAKNVLLKEHEDAFYLASDIIRDENPNVKEDDIWPIIYDTLANKLKNNIDVIYDATNFNKFFRNKVDHELLSRNVTDYKKEAYYFTTDVNVCINRVNKRNKLISERYLPLDVILPYQQKIEPPQDDEHFEKVVIINNTKNNEKYEIK